MFLDRWHRLLDGWHRCWTGGIDVVLGQYSKRGGGWSGQRSMPVRPHVLDRLDQGYSGAVVTQELDVRLDTAVPSVGTRY